MIRFENGAMLNIEASFAAHIERGHHELQRHGHQGRRPVGPRQCDLHRPERPHGQRRSRSFLPANGWGNIWPLKMRNFVEHCLHGKPSLSPAEDGLMVQKMLDAIYESAAKGGKEVPIR